MPVCGVCHALYPSSEKVYRRGRHVMVKRKCPNFKKHGARKRKRKEVDWIIDETGAHKLIRKIALERNRIHRRRFGKKRERKKCAF